MSLKRDVIEKIYHCRLSCEQSRLFTSFIIFDDEDLPDNWRTTIYHNKAAMRITSNKIIAYNQVCAIFSQKILKITNKLNSKCEIQNVLSKKHVILMIL